MASPARPGYLRCCWYDSRRRVAQRGYQNEKAHGISMSTRIRSSNSLGHCTNQPECPRLLGGHGPSRKCYQNDGIKDFHDGGGLCSPGRWPRQRGGYAEGPSWDWLRARIREIVVKRAGSEAKLEKEAFRMASGGEDGCRLAPDPALQEELLDLLDTWVQGQF